MKNHQLITTNLNSNVRTTLPQQQRKKKQINQKDQHIIQLTNQVIQKRETRRNVPFYLDTYASTTATSTPSVVDLSNIPQGVAQSDRLSDTVHLTGLELRIMCNYSFSSSVFAQDVFDTFRFTVFLYKFNSGSLVPGGGQIYQSTGTFGVLSPLNFEDSQFISVLSDDIITTSGFYDSNTTVAFPNDGSVKIYSKYYPLNSTIKYNLGLASGTSKLYLAFYSDSTITPHPAFTYCARLRYTNVY